MASSPTYIDVFSGAGGLSEGFIRAGYKGIAHIEADVSACQTVETRLAYWHLRGTADFPHYQQYLLGEVTRSQFLAKVPGSVISSVIQKEISPHSLKSIYERIESELGAGKVDVLVGGPPCQAYSLVGRSRDPRRMRGDHRNFLFRSYARFLKRYSPRFFVFENVLGLLSAGNSRYLTEMLALFGRAGYQTDLRVVNSEDFGVLQRRRRVIIIGRRGKRRFHFPDLPTVENHWKVGPDLLDDLPKLEQGTGVDPAYYERPASEYLERFCIRNGNSFTTQHLTRSHDPRDLEIYAIAIQKWTRNRERLKYSELPDHLRTHKNVTGFLDRFKVIDRFGHSHTLMAHISKDGHYYIYPDERQVRSLSVREAARIQSFPDDYHFEGGRTAAFRQIGNAVPPVLAEVIAGSIKALL